MRDLGDDFVEVHFAIAVKFSVAEMAAQVAAGLAHKGGGLTDAQALALNGIKDLVYLQDLPAIAPDRQVAAALFVGVLRMV